jgi:predicted dehydrogenase
MLKIGLLGVGHLGKIHLKCIRLAAEVYELIGFYDPDPEVRAYVSREFGVPAFDSAAALISAAEVVDIVTPTPLHYELVKQALEAGKHVFVEKPLTETVEQGRELIELARDRGLLVQVGHVERFNPALLALENTPLQPMFIEAHRLATFNPRGTDVSVVLDLMIHDLDIVLNLVGSEVVDIHAGGVAVVSTTPDIANARLEFANGCVANITASRISLKQMRKLRLFQPNAYISLDLLDKEAQVVRLLDAGETAPATGQQFPLETPRGTKTLHLDMPTVEPVNAIRMELETFAESIRAGRPPRVSIEDGYRALELAQRITADMESRLTKLDNWPAPTPNDPS